MLVTLAFLGLRGAFLSVLGISEPHFRFWASNELADKQKAGFALVVTQFRSCLEVRVRNL